MDRWVRRLAGDAPFRDSGEPRPAATIVQADARCLPLQDRSVDLVITSPPYGNAIDYLRCNKFSLVWMGYRIPDLRHVRGGNIGTEAAGGLTGREHDVKAVLAAMTAPDALPKNLRGVLARYVRDMRRTISELHRVLKPSGRCVLVIGNSTMRGEYVSNSVAMELLAGQVGFKLVEQTSREIPDDRRYLPPPNTQKSGKQLRRRMREEVVLTLQKGSDSSRRGAARHAGRTRR